MRSNYLRIAASTFRLCHVRAAVRRAAAIRSGNGVPFPFGSANALLDLSRLAAWWLSLGIEIARLGNGSHERMYRTLYGMSCLQQRSRFDVLRGGPSAKRAHEALAVRRPADLYQASRRPWHGLLELDYPFHDLDILVTACGRARNQHFRPRRAEARYRGSRRRHLARQLYALWSRRHRPGAKSPATPQARGCHPCLRHEVVTHVHQGMSAVFPDARLPRCRRS